MNLNLPAIERITAFTPEATPELVIKPEQVLMQVGGFVQLQAFLRTPLGELPLAPGDVQFSCDGSDIAAVNSDDGATRLLTVGAANVVAAWKGSKATAQINVVASAANTPLAYVIALDNSQSMKPMMLVAKWAAEVAYSGINVIKDQVSLLTFTTDSDEVKPMALNGTLAPSDFQNLKATEGKTSIATAFDGAQNEFASSNVAPNARIVILVSDGNDYLMSDEEYRQELFSLVDAFKDAGGIVLVIGINAFDTGYDLLQRVASSGYFINLTGDMDYVAQFAAGETIAGMLGFFCGANPVSQISPPAQRSSLDPWLDTETGSIRPRYEAVSVARADTVAGMKSIVKFNTNLDDGTPSSNSESQNGRSFLAFTSKSAGWISNYLQTSGVFLQFHFLSTRAVTAYEIVFPPNAPTAWAFQGSNDGAAWTTLDVQTAVSSMAGQKTRFEISNLASFSYYRILVTAGNGLSTVGIQRLQFYGVRSPAMGRARCWSDLSDEDAQEKADALAALAANGNLNLKRNRIPGVVITPNAGAIGGGLNIAFAVNGYTNARIRYTIGLNQHPSIPSFDSVPSQSSGVEYDGTVVALPPLANVADKLYVRAVARYIDHMDSIFTEAVFTL